MERDLVRRAQTGDHDAFAELVRDVLGRIYGTARLILLDQGRAEGAARDALILGWREIRRLEDPYGFEPWLQGIVVGTSKAAAREDADVTTADVDESRQAFGTLSPDDRAILALAYFAGLTKPEISIALGVPRATADAELQRAFDALRAALEVDDTANARVDLEWRLRSWLAREAAPPDLTTVSEAVFTATRSAGQRRRGLGLRRRGSRQDPPRTRRVTGRRAAIAVVTSVAVVGAILAGVVVTRIVRPGDEHEAQVHGPPVGLVIPTADISKLAGTLDEPAIAVLSDGRVLVEGLGDVVLGAVVYDPATGAYSDPIRDDALLRGSTATTLQNSLVLLTGGTFAGSDSPAVTTVLFDPYSKTFATTNPLSVARAGHTATLLDDGRVLIAGGRHAGRSSSGSALQLIIDDKSAETYDPATGRFTPSSPMVHARTRHTSTKLQDGRVLIAGGYIPTQSGGVGDAVADAELFDPATGTFQVAATMITPRGDHSATLLSDGRVLIVGGSDLAEGDGPHSIPDAEIFDPVTARFIPVGSLITERNGHSATLLADGRVLVAGGRNEFGDPRSTEIFDPSRGTFALGPKAGAPHHASLAPLVAGGRVLLTGSGPGASELFDATASAVAPTPSATAPSGPFRAVGTGAMRTSPTLVELDDGRVLILAGWYSATGNTIGGVEIFDPKTGQTAPAGTLLDPLSGAIATRLPGGRIFVVGDGPNGTALAEVFDPSTGSFSAASEATERSVSPYHPFAAAGLPDGHLLLTDAVDSIRMLDAATGVLGPPIRVCESLQSAVAMDATRILVGCGDGAGMVTDVSDGTSEPTDFAFDRAVRLDSRRIALVSGSWHFGDNGGAPVLDRITAIYDTTAGIQSVPDGTGIGDTVVVIGERLLAFGGTASDGSRSGRSVSIDTRSWASTEIGQMLVPRTAASAITLRDGRVLI